MDNKMIDTEDQRDDRKMLHTEMPTETKHSHALPNRKMRRRIAKQRGIFKHPRAWGYVNGRGDGNKPYVKGDTNER